LYIKILKCVHFVGLICNNYITMNKVKNVKKEKKRKEKYPNIFVFMYGLFDCNVRNSNEAMPALYLSCGTVELSLSN